MNSLRGKSIKECRVRESRNANHYKGIIPARTNLLAVK